jgi:hypothetical protein
VDFLYHKIPMIIEARLLIYIITREIGYTYEVDRTTVTVGVPKYAGDIHNPSLYGCLIFNMGSLRLLSSSSRGGVWPPLFCRRLRVVVPAACCAASSTVTLVVGAGLILLSVAPHRVPGLFSPLVHKVGRRNILRQLKTQLSVYSTQWKVLDYTTGGTHLLAS